MPAVRKLRLVLGGLLVLALAVLHLAALDSGVDLEDESVYIALPYRFVLGDRPYVDEVNPIQCAALVSMPIVRALHLVLDGTDGLVLATRLAACGLEVLVASLVWMLLRARLGAATAALIAVTCVVLAPQRASLSYASLMSTFSTAGLVLVALARERNRAQLLPAAGAALGLACVAFPPALFGFACGLGGLPRLVARIPGWILLVAGGLAVLLLFTPSLLDMGAETLQYSSAHLETRGTWTRRSTRILEHAASYSPLAYVVLLSVVGVALALGQRWARVGAVLASALPLCAYVELGPKSGSWSTVLVASAAPLLVFRLWRDPWMRALFLGLWVPSALVGLAQALSGSSGVLLAGFGLAPGCIVSLSAMALLAERALRESRTHARTVLPLVPPSLFGAVLLVAGAQVQNDAPSDLRTARVASGPYRGLWTTERKRRLIEDLGAELRALDDGTRRLLCYYLLPGGYLMTRMRPASNNAWGLYCYPKRLQHVCLEPYIENLGRFGGDGVVILKLQQSVGLFGEPEPEPTGPADEWIRAHYELVVDRPEFDVFVGEAPGR